MAPKLREAVRHTESLEYALYTRQEADIPDRLAHGGWIRGGVRDLAMLVQRAAVPPPRIEALATELENGVRTAGYEFTRRHKYGGELGARVAKVLGQEDDAEGQTRRMVMTVIANALVFHESLAEAEFQVEESEGGPERAVRPVATLPSRRFVSPTLTFAWNGNASCASTTGPSSGPPKRCWALCLPTRPTQC